MSISRFESNSFCSSNTSLALFSFCINPSVWAWIISILVLFLVLFSFSFAILSSSFLAFVSFSPTSWASSTISARGALIYNSTQSDKAVAVLDFGDTKTTTNQTLTIEFPTADSSSAIIRIE